MKNRASCSFEANVDFYTIVVPKIISEEISSPINAQMFDFCDPELFSETLQNSEFNSGSNCCYDKNSSCVTNVSHSPETDNNGNGNGNTVTTAAAASFIPVNDASAATTNIAANGIFDSQEELDNDISASIDFSPSASFSIPQYLSNIHPGQFDVPQVQSQLPLVDPMTEGLMQCPMPPVATLLDDDLPSIYVDDCLSSLTSYMPLNPSSPSCSFVGATMTNYLPAASMNPAASSVESCGMFSLLGTELQPHDLDYQGDNCGVYSQDYMQGTFHPPDLQVVNNEKIQVGGGGGAMKCTGIASELSSLKDSSFKVGKLSVEERKEKIHRYMKKRNERNFSKKIKYACRKTLADSRPRVRGRFAKNDELAETQRAGGSNHEREEEVVVKKEDSLVDSSVIFAHITGVNSFKCNYTIQSWI
ncbi:uncharacterized protein LOC111464531 isoform X1 [Cucurbita moschata]|uniref:Uncharacterized protein LOC111464531 isoform X1 n=1 Tax=Cucurbita moschata TaxID=3662 RepID=A0A6J1HJ57_CUCMO|nr:uncharacterized protein LOC111464531 isoform X1 [Cucurbita moschata]